MRIAFLSLLIFCATLAQAQKNYVPAILIGPRHDSLHGFIDYRNWRVTPHEISFKSLSGEERKCTAKDMEGFLIVPENELYLSRQVKLDVTSQTIDNLMSQDKRTYQEDTVFLLSIVQATYNLYVYTDEHDQAHFVYDGPGTPATELQVVKKRVDNSRIQTINYYQQQLTNLFAQCPEISKRSLRAPYSEAPLRNLFLAYHQCQHPSTQAVVKQKERKGLTWGLLAGASFDSYHFNGVYWLTAGKYGPSQTPLLGVFAGLAMNRDRQRFWLSGELFYRSANASGGLPANNFRSSDPIDVNFKFSYLQLNVLFRYVYPKGAFRPFANIGLGNSLMIKEAKNEVLWAGSGADKEPAIDDIRKHEECILGGLGLKHNRFELEARYSTANGFSSYNSLSIVVQSWQVIARMSF